jgi:hypothetical protein
MSLPTQEELMEWLSYDKKTGIFRWIKEPRTIGPLLGKMAGTVRRNGYVFINLRGYGPLGAHRLAWIYCFGQIPLDIEIDHADGNPFNNAIRNLRLATSSEQKQNKCVQSNNRSGLKGAYYHACHHGKKWRSQIKVGGDLIFLGYFHTAEEAHAAYSRAAHELFGEFARTA